MSRRGAVESGRYRMSREGQSSSRGGLQGMYILQEGAGCQIYKPTWNATRTVFRPFPGLDPERPRNDDGTPNWDPFRMSDGAQDFGDWIRRYDMAMGLGIPGITFVTKDPRERDRDDQQNPVWMMQRSINQAVRSPHCPDPAWNPLILGGEGRGAPLSKPKDGYVMQGILMEHKSKPQTPPLGCLMEHKPVVLFMSQSAGQALIDKLEERDAEGNLIWGDITDLNSGMFIQFHQAGTQNDAMSGGAPQQMGQAMAASARPGVGGGSSPATNAYEVKLLEVYNGIQPTFPDIHTLAPAHVKPWDEIIRIPTVEEQVRLISNSGIPASAVVYALSDTYGDMIPQHVFDQANAQPQGASAPNADAGAAANPMQPSANPMQPSAQPASSGGMVGGTAREQDPAMPAANTNTEMPSEQAPTGPAPETAVAEGFDQPTHADDSRSRNTQEALAAARKRKSGAPA